MAKKYVMYEDGKYSTSDGPANIGNLSDLNTEDKSSIVGAINEVVGDITDVGNNVGDLSNLDTEVKTSLVAAINEINGKIGNYPRAEENSF